MHRLSPKQVLEHLRAGNERFMENMRLNRDHLKDVKHTAVMGQFPIAAVIGCMDSRAPSAIILDQGIGDLFSLNIAGNIVNDDLLGSLEYACHVTGTKLILVLGHTECGAVNGAIDCVHLGNLTGLLEKIKPVIERVSCSYSPATTANKEYVDAVAKANVEHSIEEICKRSEILRGLEQQEKIMIVGGMYDVHSGRIIFFEHPAA